MKSAQYANTCFGADLSTIDPDIDQIIKLEEERQARRLILIPSESYAPAAVRQALGSVFNNVYAEGYPPLRMTRDDERLLLDLSHQLAYYRRYADRRFYKGVDYVHFVETLAQRRCAACFANERVSAENIYVNVQPLSGAAANLAVYDALLEPGDTLMGLDLFQGGHLTHGSEFNVSGRRYKVVSYGVSRATERLDYDQIMDLAKEHRPKIIIAGYTSYSWAPDWRAFREIADAVGAYLMADIAHTAGMAVAGVYPNPVGIADVTTFTTHKTICGPRGAVIMTTDEDIANLIDMAVFPGLQGGPHPNKFAAMAVAFQIARMECFRDLQRQIVVNARALADALLKRGMRLAYGGTDTHLVLLDLKGVDTPTGFLLYGEPTARILDLCGIVVNRNTIPWDEITALGTGIRMGTPWITQRGLDEQDMDTLAGLIHRIVTNIHPFSYQGLAGELPRGKIDLDILEEVKCGVQALAEKASAETPARGSGYPHYCFLSTEAPVKTPVLVPAMANPEGGVEAAHTTAALLDDSDLGLLRVSGWRAEPFLQQVSTADVAALRPGHALRTFILDREGALLDDVAIIRRQPDERGRDNYLVLTNPANSERIKAWFRALSDGYVLFDNDDVFRKVEGPAMVEDLDEDVEEYERQVAFAVYGPQAETILRKAIPQLPPLTPRAVWQGDIEGAEVTVARLGYQAGAPHFEFIVPAGQASVIWRLIADAGAVEATSPDTRHALRREVGLPDYDGDVRPTGLELYRNGFAAWFDLTTPYFVGQDSILKEVTLATDKARWEWEEPEGPPRHTPLYDKHRELGAKIIPFAGWEMPVWYTSVSEEHQAVRQAAGLFDVAHMGVLEVSGEYATHFLDAVTTNYVRWLEDGQSQYTYLLTPEGKVIDDLIVYRRRADLYVLVVNAANAEKDWAWLNAVNSGGVVIDPDVPARSVEGKAVLRNLKDPAAGADQRVDIALQGPAALSILQCLTSDPRQRDALARVRRTDLIEMDLAGMNLIIARTGYTGEDIGYEILVHPDEATRLWDLLMVHGAPFGIKPAGLAARDSTRIEAGLPLYGHELAGPYDINPLEAGFPGYVKFHKPFFVGRRAMIEAAAQRSREVIRFRLNETGARALRGGETVVNRRGQYIGRVTSCTLIGATQMGMALVDRRYTEPGSAIAIYPAPPRRRRPSAKPPAELEPGDKVVLPEWATILTRFPEEEGEKDKIATKRFFPAHE
ncbi:MAG: glycine cleavage system aminomethyltransferase GcvT [Anaerolineae bacterium]|nr:glycine cleavage system aminomethyltransferase GcvT [Anaerolineae bacterium]